MHNQPKYKAQLWKRYRSLWDKIAKLKFDYEQMQRKLDGINAEVLLLKREVLGTNLYGAKLEKYIGTYDAPELETDICEYIAALSNIQKQVGKLKRQTKVPQRNIQHMFQDIDARETSFNPSNQNGYRKDEP